MHALLITHGNEPTAIAPIRGAVINGALRDPVGGKHLRLAHGTYGSRNLRGIQLWEVTPATE